MATVPFEADIHWHCLSIRLVNLAIFAVAMLSFELLLHYILEDQKKNSIAENAARPLPLSTLKNSLLIAFGSCALAYNGVYQDTPDLLVSTFVYLALASALAFKLKPSIKAAFALGAACAVGFWAKAIFTPICACLMILLLFYARRKWIAIIPLAMLLLGASPLVIGYYQKFHSLQASEANRMSYVEVLSLKYKDHWAQGKELLHPARKIQEKPLVFEFAEPIAGTYPIWYERLYWLQGYKYAFEPAYSIFFGSINLYYYLTRFLAGIIAGYLVLRWGLKERPYTAASLKDNAILFVPALLILGCYISSTSLSRCWEERYYGTAVLLLLSACLCSLRIPHQISRKRMLCSVVLFLSPLLFRLGEQLITDSFMFSCSKTPDWQVATALRQVGLRPGDRVAQLGFQPGYEFIKCGPHTLTLCAPLITGHFWINCRS